MRLALAVLVASLPAIASARPRWEQLPLPPPMPAPTAHGTVKVGGASIYYARFGKRDGNDAPVILLHGGMGSGDQWSHQVKALEGSHDVIAIDSRGQGRSTRTKQAASYAVMASDVLAVMDHLKVDKAALVGWSDGGEIALELATEHPDRVAKLVVFGANYDAKGSKPRGPRHRTFSLYAAKCRADYKRMSATPKQFGALVAWLLPMWRKPMGFTKDQLRAIRAPTLVGDGDHDEIILLDQVKEMAKLIPHAKLAVLENTSHFAMWQDPGAFDKMLVEFLDGTSSGHRAR